jgi:chorismate mutase
MDIERWRKEIDELDEELLRLLNMRARLAVKVGSLKRATGMPVRDPEREEFVLQRLREANTGPLDQEAVVRLFRRIIRESRRVEALADEQVDTSSVSQLHRSTNLRGIA